MPIPRTPVLRNAVRKALLSLPGGLPARRQHVEQFVERRLRAEGRLPADKQAR